jgi:hypothetical protein
VSCWHTAYAPKLGHDRISGGYVPHVELSITDLGQANPPPARDPMATWIQAVVNAAEPCLVINADAEVVAMSRSCVALLGLPAPPIGEPLHGPAFRLIDFSAQAGALTGNEVAKIPPLLSLSSARLARGLIRVEYDGSVCTLDAIATPLGALGAVIGSLTFLSPV